jgi:aspartate aminotransferase/aminotransferase
MNKPLQISNRLESIPEALSIYINQLVYDLRRMGKDITVLSLGEAFFDIPLLNFKKLDIGKGFHYSDSQGLPELRNKISNYYKNNYNSPVEPDNILISAGSKILLFMVMQAILNQGDEVLIIEPAWLSYQEQCRLVGAEPVFIKYDEEIENFGKYITDKTKVLIINNPNNPAGRLYTKSELLLIYNICRKQGIYVVVDEAYSDFVGSNQFISMASVVPDKDGIIVVNSLSKNMGMSGWRVGYAISSIEIIRSLLKLNQHLITCAPTILQEYMAYYFDKVISITLPQVDQVVKKREKISKMIDKLGLKRLAGTCTFYFFINVEKFLGTYLELSLILLLKHSISVVPGSAYGQSTKDFIRVSIGAEPEERIWDALCVIRDTINSNISEINAIDEQIKNLGFLKYEDIHNI